MKNKMIILLTTVIILSNISISVTIIPFSSPENSLYAINNFIENSEKSIYISSYTFSSPELANTIARLSNERKIIILVEGSPVGGIPNKTVLCYMQKNGAEVLLYEGNLKFNHGKYIIVDNSSYLISTENFGENLEKNRGYGIAVFDGNEKLLETFLNDIKHAKKMECEKYSNIESETIAKKELKRFDNQSAEILIGPNLTDKFVSLLDSANKTIYIEQFYIKKNFGKKMNPLLEEIIKKAKEGVKIKVLLDSKWYSVKNNQEIVDYLKNFPNIEAKLINLDEFGYDKLHSKLIIIDEKIAVVSSVNWSETSLERNRETGVILKGSSVEYFIQNFRKDWKGSNNVILYVVVATTIIGAISLKKALKEFT